MGSYSVSHDFHWDCPYKGRWDIEQEGNDSTQGCTLRVYTNVAFSKKTMWKGSSSNSLQDIGSCADWEYFAGKIVQSTVEECREAYEIWIDLVSSIFSIIREFPICLLQI